MKFFAVAIATFAAVAAAAPAEQVGSNSADLYLSGDVPNKPAPAPAPTKAPSAPPASGSGSKCTDCASYCSDPSNGSAIGAACYIVKCGITCLIG